MTGLAGAYATGFNGPNEILSLDVTNGFQVSAAGKTYKTAGAGSTAITGTGAGGGVTLTDIANWINGLTDANLSASVVGSGSSYSLEVSYTNPLSSLAITLDGINSGEGGNITTLGGFSSATGSISLDAVDGFM